MAYIVATGWYESFTGAHYMAVGIALVTPGLVVPALTQPPQELARPWWRRYWVKDHVWLWIVVFVGSYLWTHYFYTLLKATYTFQAWRLNDVPFAMYLAAHGYFVLYHSATNMALRRWYTSRYYATLPPAFATAGTGVLVIVMAWVTAFMEAFTIQGFPYYHIEDRSFMYTVGAIVYGLYFVVSFPMHYQLDGGEPEDVQAQGAAAAVPAKELAEGAQKAQGPASRNSRELRALQRDAAAAGTPAKEKAAAADGVSTPAAAPTVDFHGEITGSADWSLWSTAVHAFGATMIVTLLLDFWRLAYSAAAGVAPEAAAGLPWTGGNHTLQS